MTTVVDRDDRVKVPADLSLKPGTLLDWERGTTSGVFIVKVLTNRLAIAESLLGAGCKYLQPGQDPVADLVQEREEEDRARDAAL